ncbi:MAG: CopG family transcriptional regulator [Lautropia sp.]|nr:CopG family transcriptional regulator [Lautropia sp.]
MVLSIRLPAEDEALVERAAHKLRISRSEFIRRSIAEYASKVVPPERSTEEIDALYLGQGGLRDPADVTDPLKRQVLTRLRAKYGYTD